MNHNELSARVLPGLLSGTRRKPLPLEEVFPPSLSADPKAELKALALTGQFLRFARPAPPTMVPQSAPLSSDRPFLAAELRKPFLKLVADLPGENAARIADAVAAAMDRRRVAPHPFDLESAGAFVTGHAAQLGALAFDFTQRRKPAVEQQAYFDWAALDDSCWAQAALGQRERFLRQRRLGDPAAALALLEAEWANCNAEERFRLLSCLRTGLSAADQAFLSGLAKDRAPRVRETAAAMLARLVPGEVPGSLKNLLERLKEGQSGLLRKRRTFSLEYPANLKENARLGWLFDSYGQLGIDMITRALDCSPADLVEGAAKDEGLLFILALAAGNERRFDLLETIVAALPDAWDRLAGCEFEGLPEYSPAELETWIRIVVRPQAWADQAGWNWPGKLLAVTGNEPLAPALFDALLSSPWARSSLSGQGHFQYRAVESLALLCPPAQRATLLRLIRADDDETQPVRWFLEFLIALEAPQHG